MVARQLEQARGIEFVCRQAGDGVDDLACAAVFQFTDALDPADRGDARSVFIEPRRQLGAHGDAAGFDSAVAFVDGLGTLSGSGGSRRSFAVSGAAVTIARGGNVSECPFELGAQLRLVAFDEQEIVGSAFSNGQGNRFVCERRVGCDDGAIQRTFIVSDKRKADRLGIEAEAYLELKAQGKALPKARKPRKRAPG